MSEIGFVGVVGGADLSEDRLHRYRLWRYLPPLPGTHNDGSRVLWLMLNPSTADELQDDLTVKKCVGFARRWGHGNGRVEICNLFSYRATDPAHLWAWLGQHPAPLYQPEQIVSRNESAIVRAALRAHTIVLAWGDQQKQPAFKSVSQRMIGELDRLGLSLYCLGLTKRGYPRHPSRLGYDTELVRFIPPAPGS